MNKTLETYGRECMRDGLLKLPAGWQRTFKLMYGRDGGSRSIEDAESLTIDQVVGCVKPEQIDWAMQQIQNSINKLNKQTLT